MSQRPWIKTNIYIYIYTYIYVYIYIHNITEAKVLQAALCPLKQWKVTQTTNRVEEKRHGLKGPDSP
jgi:hypothetical protein